MKRVRRCEWCEGNPLYIEYHDKEWGVPVHKDRKLFEKDLKRRGFKFVGSTIMYAHMQAVGMVNDHLVSCFRYREV